MIRHRRSIGAGVLGSQAMSPRPAFLLLVLALTACSIRPPPATERADERSPTPVPTPTASRQPNPSTTARATPTPQPTATPDAGGLEALELQVTGCPGGVALDWSPATGTDFHHYTALRSLADDVDPAYPPIAPAVDWGDTYVTDRFVTSAVDATLIPSEVSFSYRVMAYDARNRPLAASAVRRTRPTDVVDLGALVVEAGDEGISHIDWGLFGGLGRCFSAYRVLVGPAGGTPSETLTVISEQGTTEIETDALRSGVGYVVQVETVRSTTVGEFVVAHTAVVSYTAPAAP